MRQYHSVIIAILLSLFTSASAFALCPTKTEECKSVDFTKPRVAVENETGCFRSKALDENVCYTVTFPRGFPEVKPSSYAIFLHGRDADNRQFSDFSKSCRDRNNPIFSDYGPPVPIIAPAQTEHTYWKNSLDGRKVADMVTKDLIQEVETAAKGKLKSERAIFGISMGGHGAMFLALQNPTLFTRVNAISPIFRGEDDLLPQDRAGFGEGLTYAKNDPVSLIKTKGMPQMPFRIEIANGDPLYKKQKATQDFFSYAMKQYPDFVRNDGQGGHDLTFWCGALNRAMIDFRTTPVLQLDTAKKKPTTR